MNVPATKYIHPGGRERGMVETVSVFAFFTKIQLLASCCRVTPMRPAYSISLPRRASGVFPGTPDRWQCKSQISICRSSSRFTLKTARREISTHFVQCVLRSEISSLRSSSDKSSPNSCPFTARAFVPAGQHVEGFSRYSFVNGVVQRKIRCLSPSSFDSAMSALSGFTPGISNWCEMMRDPGLSFSNCGISRSIRRG